MSLLNNKLISTTKNLFDTLSTSIKEQAPQLQRKILNHSHNFLNQLPAHFEVWAQHAHPQSKELYLKNTYLRQLETVCIALPKRNAFVYFGFLPVLILATILVTSQCLQNHKTIIHKTFTIPLNPISLSMPTVKTTPVPITSAPVIALPAQRSAPIANSNHLEYANITIHRSIYLSGKKSGISAKTVSQLISIFNGAVNFARDVHDGDRVVFLYSKTAALANGAKKALTTSGNDILAAELISHKKTYRAIKFTDAAGHSDYYSPEGVSFKPAFMRAPTNNARITSKFNLHRWHPILHVFRAHKGVDFAAPQGTPIKATGAGKIVFAGWEGGYGKAILIQHDGKYSSFYAHLAGFAKKLNVGSYVKQNQLIGYMGATGLATGSHVHYEFRVNGVQHDPLSVALPHLAINSRANRIKFFSLAKTMLAQLETHNPQYYAVKSLNNTRPAV